MAAALAEQLQRHHGCENDPHLNPSPPASETSVTLSALVRWACPDVLRPPEHGKIAQYPTDWDTLLPPLERRTLFTGLSPSRAPRLLEPEESPGPLPDQPCAIDLEADTVSPENPLQVLLDIDSAGGFASSLAVAREGISWKARRANISNLQSSLHLAPVRVFWLEPDSSTPRTRLKPVHQVPHLPFGRLEGFSPAEVYLLFPRLFNPSLEHYVIGKEEWRIWIDEIFLPSVHVIYPSSIVQHLPSSAQHIERNANAPQVEAGVQASTQSRAPQDFHFSLQAGHLGALWEEIQHRVEQAGHVQFQDCQIIFTAKNLKLQTQQSTWAGTRELFFSRWNRAIDPTYLQQDFYDLAKEVIPRQGHSGGQALSDKALMLSWRRCCLDGCCAWLVHQNAISAPLDEDLSSPSASDRSSLAGESDSDTTTDQETVLGVSESEAEEPFGPVPGDETPAHAPKAPPGWRVEFYPQSFLRDQGSMTIAPSRSSSLWKRGLRYCQMYNTSKEIFAAGNRYLFSNERLDTLALDPGMVRSWQHAGGAVSHSPLAVLRAYLHTKQRCSVALAGCRDRSYGTREEYRVTGAVLVALDALFCEQGIANHPLEPPASSRPFFTHPTTLMLDWWRWNINKLCLGFEMTYSIRPRTFVHWEHTRVMMMFLQCLMRVYGGQGHHLRRSLGLWIDRRTRAPAEGSDLERVQEGMAMGVHLAHSGYAWMADKLNWGSMVFLPVNRPNMVFNTPSLQSAYIRRYRNVVQAKDEFLLFHDIFSFLHQHRSDCRRSALLLQLLVDVCLRAFRQEVFRSLSTLKLRQPLHPQRLREGCAGLIPLTGAGLRSVFEHGQLLADLHFVSPQRATVNHIETLFVFLWGWDGDGNQGDWARKSWEFRAYRILFRQCFGVIAQIYGVQQARAWRLRVKETWIRTHLVVPYPSQRSFWAREAGALQTWASRHSLVEQYYQQCRQPLVIPPHDVDQLPVWGWGAGPAPSPFDVTFYPVPSDLNAWLAVVESTGSGPSLPDGVPLPAAGMREGPLSRFLREQTPEHRVLRSFARQHKVPPDRIHENHIWLHAHLADHMKAVVVAHQQEISQVSRHEYQSWRRRRRPRLEDGLREVGLCVAQLEDEDSDPGTLRSGRDRMARRLGRMQVRLREVQKHVQTLDGYQHQKDRYCAHLADRTITRDEWEKSHREQFRALRRQREVVLAKLERVSRQSTGTWL